MGGRECEFGLVKVEGKNGAGKRPRGPFGAKGATSPLNGEEDQPVQIADEQRPKSRASRRVSKIPTVHQP